ncbi:Phosphate-binding protein PstS precursor, partial [Haemophilus influenzae]
TTKNVLAFFDWAFSRGQDAATELDYVPIPADVVSTIKSQWKTELKQ